jgi:hypothetical protein
MPAVKIVVKGKLGVKCSAFPQVCDVRIDARSALEIIR